jgi:hypothetical protein
MTKNTAPGSLSKLTRLSTQEIDKRSSLICQNANCESKKSFVSLPLNPTTFVAFHFAIKASKPETCQNKSPPAKCSKTFLALNYTNFAINVGRFE